MHPRAHWPLATVHALLLVAYALPWVSGSFGSREALSVSELARVATPLGNGTAALLLLAAFPALAADGLVVSLLGGALRLPPRLARSLAVGLAVPGVGFALVAFVLAVRESGGSVFVGGPALGLYLAIAAAMLLAATLARSILPRGAAPSVEGVPHLAR